MIEDIDSTLIATGIQGISVTGNPELITLLKEYLTWICMVHYSEEANDSFGFNKNTINKNRDTSLKDDEDASIDHVSQKINNISYFINCLTLKVKEVNQTALNELLNTFDSMNALLSS